MRSHRLTPRAGALLLAFVSSLVLVANARADTLDLNADAAAACPACTSSTGGAEVVNLLATMAPQDISLQPSDGAPAPPEGYVAAAARMASEAESLDQSLVAGDGHAADQVEHGIMAGLATSGAIRTSAALCLEVPYVCGVLAVGGAAVFVFAGPKALAVWINGGDSDTGTEIDGMWWRPSGAEQRLLDWARGPAVHPGEWYLEYRVDNQAWAWVNHNGPGGCNFGPPRPTVSLVRSGLANICVFDLPIEAYVRTADMMYSARKPSKRVDSSPPGATSVPAPPAPTRQQLADAAAQALNTNPTLARWLNYLLGRAGAQDPISGKVIVPSCDELSWSECRAQMEGYGFATPVKLTVPQDEVALADASAGKVVLVEGEKTGRDPDDVLGVTVMPDTIDSPMVMPIPDIDVLVETDTDITTEESGVCDLSPGEPAVGPVADGAFDPRDSLLGHGSTYGVDDTSIVALPGADDARADQTILRVGAVRANSSGFGWRHIVARHGWIAKDEELTRLTLSTPQHAIERSQTAKGPLDTYFAAVASGAWYYHRTASTLIVCARRVVVKPDRLGSWGDVVQPTEGLLADQTGVWTSYGKAIGQVALP
jgi:hypothetical protein